MGDAFNESFCEQYPISFIESCTTTCSSLGQDNQGCEKECQQALTEDRIYNSRCQTETASSPDGWSKATVKNFMRSCISEGRTEKSCLCVVDRLQQKITAKELSVMEADITDDEEPPPVVMEAVRACI